jgi:REP element-mobilizing transposase RayT
MTVRTNINATEGLCYITLTCYRWLSLFEATNGYDIIYKQFDILKSEGHSIVGYVIMPNHIHFIVDFSTTVKSINLRIGTMKRFMAYEIVSRLKELNRTDLLYQLEQGVNIADRKKGKLHEVFEPSFDIKQCLNNAFTEQKLIYIHNNPCKGVWNLSSRPEEYKHSSASFYILDVCGVYEVSHYLRLR